MRNHLRIWKGINEKMKNRYGIEVKECCASCQHKENQKDGSRVCAKMQLLVEAKNCCRLWEMSEGLENAGLQTGGVVRLKGTPIVLIH